MRRRLVVVAAVALVGLALVRLAVTPTHLGGYVEIDDYNIALQVIGAGPMWRGVTEHTETGSSITVVVSQITLPQFGAGFGDERIAYVAVRLSDPLAGRQVIDATTGTAIPRISQ
jgi:hypothetical protein